VPFTWRFDAKHGIFDAKHGIFDAKLKDGKTVNG
jgi:hypothetical protein